MTKIAYNADFGGFSLSSLALFRYAELKGWTAIEAIDSDPYFSYFYCKGIDAPDIIGPYYDFERDDPILIQVIEELGEKSYGHSAKLWIRDIPEGTKYVITNYDGAESVMTPDDFDWKIA